MTIAKGTTIKINKEVTIPIMPPILFGRLQENRVYQVDKVHGGEVNLTEVNNGARHQVTITLEQLMEEIQANSVDIEN